MENQATRKIISWNWCRNLIRLTNECNSIADMTEKIVEALVNYLGFEQCNVVIFNRDVESLEKANSYLNLVDRYTIQETLLRKQPIKNENGDYIFPIESNGTILGLIFIVDKHLVLKNETSFDLFWAFVDNLSNRILVLQNIEELESDIEDFSSSMSNYTELKGFLETSLDKLKLLEEQNKKLTELDQIRTQLINTVSHELKTPLVSIMGFSNLLKRHELTEDLIRESGEQILHAGQRLSRMIDDFLQLNKADAQGWKISFEPVDIGEVAHYVVDELAPINKKHCFVYSFPEEYPLVEGDGKLLRQVIDNLLSNAIKYSPDGGKITCSIKVLEKNLEFTVKDEGIGVAPEDCSRIFDRFFRVKNSDTEKISGMGLGLSICKDIVNAMYGNIICESGFSKGTAFTISLPLKQS